MTRGNQSRGAAPQAPVVVEVHVHLRGDTQSQPKRYSRVTRSTSRESQRIAPGLAPSDCCRSAGDAREGVLPVRSGLGVFAAIQSPGAVLSQRLPFAPEWNICTVMAHTLLLPASSPAPGLSARWESKPFSFVKLACPSAEDEPRS